MVRRDKTNLPPARFLAPLESSESSILPPLGLKHIPRPRASTGMNTADRAIHRATQKGYTAGRMPVYEPKIKTPATVNAWCDSVRDANQLMSAGSCSGWLGGNRRGARAAGSSTTLTELIQTPPHPSTRPHTFNSNHSDGGMCTFIYFFFFP